MQNIGGVKDHASLLQQKAEEIHRLQDLLGVESGGEGWVPVHGHLHAGALHIAIGDLRLPGASVVIQQAAVTGARPPAPDPPGADIQPIWRLGKGIREAELHAVVRVGLSAGKEAQGVRLPDGNGGGQRKAYASKAVVPLIHSGPPSERWRNRTEGEKAAPPHVGRGRYGVWLRR